MSAVQRHHPRQRQRGFSLIAAIFIVVVLAVLGAFMVTLNVLQHATSAAALQGARAFQAAQSGIEWGVYQALHGAACSAAPAQTTSGPFALNGAGLSDFQVTVTCTYTQYQEQSTNYNVYTISATATYGTFGNPDFVSRSLVITATNAT